MKGGVRRGLPIQDWVITREQGPEFAKWLDSKTMASDLRACRNLHLDNVSLAVLGAVTDPKGNKTVYVCPDAPSMTRVLDKVLRGWRIEWRVCWAYDVAQYCPYL